MDLTYLFPEKPEFKTSEGKLVTLRLPDLEDRAWLQRILSVEGKSFEQRANEVFANFEWDVIAKIVFRLIEDKSPFEARKEEGYDDDGVKITRLITGPAVLMRSVNKIPDAINMLGAVIKALRDADPRVDEAIKESGVEKKSQLNPTGKKSLRPSPESTATRLKKSAS